MTPPDSERTAILLVDDEPRILAALRTLLRLDYDVVTSTDGYEALELLGRQRFDIIVSDQRMPTLTGVQFLRMASDVAPQAVRILLTGYSDMDAIVGAINDVEIHRFLRKPWDNDELRRVIAEAAQAAQALREAAADACGTADAMPATVPVPTDSAAPVAVPPLPAVQVAAATGDAVLLVRTDAHLEQQVYETFAPATAVLAVEGDDGCLAMLEARPCQVVVYVLDMGSPQQREFLARLKQAHPQVLVIVLSDSADSDHLVELINRARIHRFIRMPAQFSMIRRYVESALQLARRHRAQPALLHAQEADAAGGADTSAEGLHVTSRMQRIRRAFLDWRRREPVTGK
jgi:serine/threonine-protein kinase